jgi:hypothetical protein
LTAGLAVNKGEIMEHFEIRQEVKTVEKSWLETIHTSGSLRILEMTYGDLVKNNPDDYFELVRVFKEEKCLAFTPKLDA